MCISTAPARAKCASRSWDRLSSSTSPSPSPSPSSSSSSSSSLSSSSSSTSPLSWHLVQYLFAPPTVWDLLPGQFWIFFIYWKSSNSRIRRNLETTDVEDWTVVERGETMGDIIHEQLHFHGINDEMHSSGIIVGLSWDSNIMELILTGQKSTQIYGWFAIGKLYRKWEVHHLPYIKSFYGEVHTTYPWFCYITKGHSSTNKQVMNVIIGLTDSFWMALAHQLSYCILRKPCWENTTCAKAAWIIVIVTVLIITTIVKAQSQERLII